MAVLWNKIHFAYIYKYPLKASEQTFARIDFLRPSGLLVDKKGSHSVKILAEKRTKEERQTSWLVARLPYNLLPHKTKILTI